MLTPRDTHAGWGRIVPDSRRRFPARLILFIPPMLVAENRPRNLRWFHAGPLLYGDWGTSRLYVLGLAFFYTAHASVLYLAAIGLLMVAVSWAYTIVCRSFPDGGGVYTAARELSPTLSVVGATLLLSGYIMTAAISVVEAFHYFGVPESLTLPLGLVAIALIGVINWYGARSAGRFALVIAFVALGVSVVMALLVIPFFIKGVRTIEFSYFLEHSSPAGAWVSFTKICLALAGVEAVANMTGLMTKPVSKTAGRTIWPVAIEVVALNMVFGLALAGLDHSAGGQTLAEKRAPDESRLVELARDAQADPTGVSLAALDSFKGEVEAYTNAAMNVIAERSALHATASTAAARVFGTVAGVTFGLLLLSATNTAVMATVSVLFAMGQDRELPRVLTRLNFSGVPWAGLLVGMAVPALVIAVQRDVTVLAELYVLGVCGAITVTIGSVALNRRLQIRPWPRRGLIALALLLGSVSATIALTEPLSSAFSGLLIAITLGYRWARGSLGQRTAQPAVAEPATGWLASLDNGPVRIDPSRPKIMLAARGRHQAEFAVDTARRRGATLFAVYVRRLRLIDPGAARAPDIREDAAAQESLGSVALLAKANGVPFVPVYVVSDEIAAEILDYTVTYGCDTLIMGKSRRSLFSRRLEGDVVGEVAAALPDEVALITRSADTPHRHQLHIPEESTRTPANSSANTGTSTEHQPAHQSGQNGAE